MGKKVKTMGKVHSNYEQGGEKTENILLLIYMIYYQTQVDGLAFTISKGLVSRNRINTWLKFYVFWWILFRLISEPLRRLQMFFPKWWKMKLLKLFQRYAVLTWIAICTKCSDLPHWSWYDCTDPILTEMIFLSRYSLLLIMLWIALISSFVTWFSKVVSTVGLVGIDSVLIGVTSSLI